MPNLQRSEMEDRVNYDPNRPGDDNTELFGIREFRDTDNPKRIHWKRSSREETLFVKEYSRPLEKQCAIWIDRTQTKAMQITVCKSGCPDGGSPCPCLYFDAAASACGLVLEYRAGNTAPNHRNTGATATVHGTQF